MDTKQDNGLHLRGKEDMADERWSELWNTAKDEEYSDEDRAWRESRREEFRWDGEVGRRVEREMEEMEEQEEIDREYMSSSKEW